MGKRSFFPRLALVNLVRNSRYYARISSPAVRWRPCIISCGS